MIAWDHFPGAHQSGHCAQYAAAVQVELQARHVPSEYIEFEWKRGRHHGYHAVVIFRDGANFKLVDNERAKPVAVTGETNLARVKSFAPEAVKLR